MTQLNTLLARLTPREQILLAVAGALFVVIGVWTVIWQPITEQNALQKERIARYLTLISLARETQNTLPSQPAPCAQEAALAPRITKSAETANIPLTRLDPEGTRLNLTVATTQYADVMQWIAALETTACVTLSVVDMTRLTQPGQISVRMTLEDTQ